MIQKHEAQLATLSIDIQAIRVNGKRLSLAAFKQLRVGHDDHKEGSDVWGYVKYRIPSQTRYSISLRRRVSTGEETDKWIVYSRDGELYRSPVWNENRIILNELPQLFIAV